MQKVWRYTWFLAYGPGNFSNKGFKSAKNDMSVLEKDLTGNFSSSFLPFCAYLMARDQLFGDWCECRDRFGNVKVFCETRRFSFSRFPCLFHCFSLIPHLSTPLSHVDLIYLGTVHMVCRNAEKGQKALAEIKEVFKIHFCSLLPSFLSSLSLSPLSRSLFVSVTPLTSLFLSYFHRSQTMRMSFFIFAISLFSLTFDPSLQDSAWKVSSALFPTPSPSL